jgi:hypothetical protein
MDQSRNIPNGLDYPPGLPPKLSPLVHVTYSVHLCSAVNDSVNVVISFMLSAINSRPNTERYVSAIKGRARGKWCGYSHNRPNNITYPYKKVERAIHMNICDRISLL